MAEVKSLCVYCGSSSGKYPEYTEQVRAFGAEMARRGIALVYGGGKVGLMGTVADAVLNHRQSATRGGVLGVYQRASRWPEQVKAMELWGRLLAAAIEGREAGAEVVPLQARTG